MRRENKCLYWERDQPLFYNPWLIIISDVMITLTHKRVVKSTISLWISQLVITTSPAASEPASKSINHRRSDIVLRRSTPSVHLALQYTPSSSSANVRLASLISNWRHIYQWVRLRRTAQGVPDRRPMIHNVVIWHFSGTVVVRFDLMNCFKSHGVWCCGWYERPSFME